jgi:hypothetical protein
MSIVRLLRRAFITNLRHLTATDDERAKLEAAGITEPKVQGYFAWRRSLMAMVVVATVLSTGLATYRELTETDETPSLFDNVSERLTETVEEAMSDEGEETDLSMEAVKDQIVKSAAVAAVEERLAEHAAAAEEEPEPKVTALGKAAELVELAALYALSAAGLIALLTWTQFRFSSRVLLVGFLVSFFVPMIVWLLPGSWWGYDDAYSDFREEPAQFIKEVAEAFLEASMSLIGLLPTVLSLIPGVQRACLRIKTLLPEAMLPGWYLVAAAPLYALFLLVIFVGINQVASDPVFLIGMFLFLAAPAMYVLRADVFTRPLATDAEFQQMRRVQRIIALITVAAGVLLLYHVGTQNVMGIRIIGMDAKSSLLQPLDLVEFLLEFLGRSLFMTVFGADVFLMMTLASWRHQQAFAGTPGAERLDRVMTGLAVATQKSSP